MVKESDYFKDTKDYTSLSVRKAEFRRYFSDFIRNSSYPSEFLEQCDLDSARMMRRMDTAMNRLDEWKENLADVYPYFEGSTPFEQDWAYFNAIPTPSYDALEKEQHLILAATVWILDHISLNNKIHEAETEVLSQITEEMMEDDPITETATCSYSYEHLAAVQHILMHRNDDCKIYQKKSRFKRVFMDEATLKRKQHQDVPSRKRFEALLSFLDQTDIEEAVREYRQGFLQIARIFCSSLKDNHEWRYRNIVRYDQLLDRQEAIFKDGKFKLTLTDVDISDILSGKSKFKDSNLEQYQAYERELEDAAEQIGEQVRKKKILSEEFHQYFDETEEWQNEFYPAVMNEQMRSFVIRDPFAICFALLYLIDTDDDLPWLTYFSNALVYFACSFLPWHYQTYDAFNTVYDLTKKKIEHPMEALSFFQEKRYIDQTLDSMDQLPYSIEQLLYEKTGLLLPRNEMPEEYAMIPFENYGIASEEMKWMRLLLRILTNIPLMRQSSYIYPEEADGRGETEANSINAEALLKRNKNLTNEIRQLKEALHQSAKEKKQLTDALELSRKERKSEENELLQLRELMFANMQEPQQESAGTISLPVHIKQKLVIAGGHDSWLKQIKEMITGEIRYAANAKLNDHLIQYCDAVWIQTNAISHSDYYKVTDLCRRNGIPFYYFQYASAKKCAEQIYQIHGKNAS